MQFLKMHLTQSRRIPYRPVKSFDKLAPEKKPKPPMRKLYSWEEISDRVAKIRGMDERLSYELNGPEKTIRNKIDIRGRRINYLTWVVSAVVVYVTFVATLPLIQLI